MGVACKNDAVWKIRAVTEGENMKSIVHSRARLLLLAPVAVIGLAVVSCAPTPKPPTPWLAAGCIDSSIPGVPDFNFNGFANQADNANSHAVGGVVSDDGTCSGPVDDTGTIVRAADSAAAVTACDDAGQPVTNPARLVDFGYEAPVDAWTCVDAPAA